LLGGKDSHSVGNRQGRRRAAAFDRHRSGLLACDICLDHGRLALASARGWQRSSTVACMIFDARVTLSLPCLAPTLLVSHPPYPCAACALPPSFPCSSGQKWRQLQEGRPDSRSAQGAVCAYSRVPCRIIIVIGARHVMRAHMQSFSVPGFSDPFLCYSVFQLSIRPSVRALPRLPPLPHLAHTYALPCVLPGNAKQRRKSPPGEAREKGGSGWRLIGSSCWRLIASGSSGRKKSEPDA